MFLLIVCIIINSCRGKALKPQAIAEEYADELQQTKKTKAGSVSILLMPSGTDDDGGGNVYKMRITLKTNQPIKQPAIMKYMNFNIRNSFFTVCGSDTMPCNICERIPGITENDFLYMVCFNKMAGTKNSGNNLQLLISDTVAGFGKIIFEIKTATLKKLQQ